MLTLSSRPSRSATRPTPCRPRLEALEDRTVPSVTFELALDFGPNSAPVDAGFVQGTAARYSAALGYGWASPKGISLVDRGTADPLTRDFAQAGDETFLANVDNGWYTVRVFLGDAASARPSVKVLAEGTTMVVSPRTNSGQFLNYTFNIPVADGVLNLRFVASGKFALNAFSFTPTPGSEPPPTATFSNSGAVNEGSTGTVSFIDQAGGSGGYIYSYDFDNNGAFEVTGSSNASATVPASYLDDGPGSRTVRGRITDSSGASTDYTTTISIDNVAPGVTLADHTGAPGLAVNFSATVTDPSHSDASAGFTYSWNFGDGAASAQAAPSHAYSSAGVYTVTLTVTDRDGGATTKTASATITPLPTATFSNSGAVNEGSTGTVSFIDQAGGSGGYIYSYDFDNNGAFEVTGSSNASATVPASYLDDGPGSRTVRGRITDSAGAYTDYTTTISINNLAPALTLPNRTGSLGVAVNFSATVTDPSTADTNAGFTYSWNFGDGATSAQAAPSHAYSGVGVYTVTLTVTDKDGGSINKTASATVSIPGPVGDIIDTGHDKIPNFGANANITTIASGNWSSPATWSLGRIPAAGDIVSILPNFTVTYDYTSDAALKTVAIQNGGKLIFRTDISTRLTLVNFLVMEGGELRIGTAAQPVAANVKAEVIFADVAIDTTKDPSQYGNGLIALGKVTMHGAVKSDTFLLLAVEPMAGDTTLTLSEPVTGWRVGDQLVLPDTRQLRDNERGASYVSQTEYLTVSAVSVDGRVLTLSTALQFNHRGARDGDGVLEFLPHVGNLTRNVVVRSQSATGTRGHTFFTARAEVDIRYTGFAGLGRTKKDALNSTTYDANGAVTHIGTNQKGRYSVHFHHLMGPTQTPANGHQFTFVGNSVFCPLDPMPFRWGIAIHGSHYGLIKDNVLYNWAGAALVTEDGSESYNVIEHNYAVRTTGTGGRADDRSFGSEKDFGFEGSAYWFRGFNNYVRDNVAADSKLYGYTLFAQYVGDVRVPLAPGLDPMEPGQYLTVNMNATPLLEFARNEIYGVARYGLTIWWLGTTYTTPHTVAQSILKDFRVWHQYETGYFGYETNRLVVDGFVARGDKAGLAAGVRAVGIGMSDYFTKDLIIRNADMQNMRVGFEPSHRASGTQVIENSYLNNYWNVKVSPMWRAGSTSEGIGPRTTIVRNVTFDLAAVPDQTGPGWAPKANIYMQGIYQDVTNLIQRDEVFVYDYDGVAGDDFQVYYLEQAPTYILPQSTYNADGTTKLTASPEAGLTNQQNWNTYGIAWAGAVSPTNATRSGVHGFVRPL